MGSPSFPVMVNSNAVWWHMARGNLTQNELAGKLGISSGYMSQLVCGTRRPSPRLRRKMIEIMAPMTFDDLFVIAARD